MVDAVRCAIEVQNGMIERNAGVAPERRIEFRVGVHLGDVVEESRRRPDGRRRQYRRPAGGHRRAGRDCLSGEAYRQVRRGGDLRSNLGPNQLKNIAQPIRVYSLKSAARPGATAPTLPPLKNPGPPRLSIVVLPFANMGGDPEQDYFVDGVTESLTTDLSRMRGMLVIGRNTAFTFKGKAVALKQIGRELNVRYVLEGSVQRSGNRMRVNVQLVDAETGNHLWAERFDKPVADLFDMQDEIVARLANQLSTELVSAEARRSERAQSPDLFDFLFQGLAWHNKGPTSENLSQAGGFFERALALDPRNVDALVMKAMVDFFVAVYLFSEDRAARLSAAEAASIKALSLATEHALAHYCLGMVLGVTNRAEEGIAECERALAIDRNLAGAHAVIGARKLFLGRAEETEAHIQEALRLSPRDTSTFLWLTFVGTAKIYLCRHEEAVVWLRRSIEANCNNPLSHVFLAAALAVLGRLDEARAAARVALSLNPQLTIARFKVFFAQFSENQINLAGRDLIIEGVRKVGVPEG